MISPKEEEYILGEAYVPEHIVKLMAGISRGEAHLVEGYLCLTGDDWLIFVGYPLENAFSAGHFIKSLQAAVRRFGPTYAWFIAPEMPAALAQPGQERETDEYWKLPVPGYEPHGDLGRIIRKAARDLTVERSRQFAGEHGALVEEILEREKIAPRIRELYLRMADYVSYSPTSLVLNARDRRQRLCAFYVVEMGARDFAAYVVGGYSRRVPTPHASDLLFWEMISLAKEQKKEYIHLGLGVNEGIRRFKKKWGGVPFLRYEFAEYAPAPSGPLSWLRFLGSRF